jgi:hypothetical protein
LTGVLRAAAAIAALALLVLFSLAQTIVLLRGEQVACGCFGSRSTRPVQWSNLLLNAGLGFSCLFLVRPLWEAPRDGKAPPSGELILQRHFAWRRSVLVLVIASTTLTAATDTATRLVAGPRTSFNFVLRLDPGEELAEQT